MSPPLSDDDKAFIRAILDHPEELTTWLAYADWLDERDDPRSEFLRLTAELKSNPTAKRTQEIHRRRATLWAELDPNWILVFDEAPLWNCPYPGARSSSSHWSECSPTDQPDIRICRRCNQPVFYGINAADVQAFSSCGQHVAVCPRIPLDQLPAPAPELDDYDLGDADTLEE